MTDPTLDSIEIAQGFDIDPRYKFCIRLCMSDETTHSATLIYTDAELQEGSIRKLIRSLELFKGMPMVGARIKILEEFATSYLLAMRKD